MSKVRMGLLLMRSCIVKDDYSRRKTLKMTANNFGERLIFRKIKNINLKENFDEHIIFAFVMFADGVCLIIISIRLLFSFCSLFQFNV